MVAGSDDWECGGVYGAIRCALNALPPEPWSAPRALVAGPDEEGGEEEEAHGEGDFVAKILRAVPLTPFPEPWLAPCALVAGGVNWECGGVCGAVR